ncbi:MAG: dipeptide epimerase, partial [Acidobacteriota bacterium]
MNRRKFVQAAGLGGLLACLPGNSLAFADEKKRSGSATSVETEIYRLKLRHTWTTTMSSSTYRDILYVHYHHDGISGVGEGAPIVRYKEDAKGAQAAVNSVLPMLDSSDPTQFEKFISDVFARIPGQWAGKAAIDIAVMDWMGKKLGVPLYEYFGLDPNDAPVTDFSIGIDTPEITREKVKEAAAFPILKIKVGLDTDEQTIAAVRSVTDKPLRVDA